MKLTTTHYIVIGIALAALGYALYKHKQTEEAQATAKAITDMNNNGLEIASKTQSVLKSLGDYISKLPKNQQDVLNDLFNYMLKNPKATDAQIRNYGDTVLAKKYGKATVDAAMNAKG